jgi:hypothetical protein
MGNFHREPKLLPEKLVLIREHLNLTKTAIKSLLNLPGSYRVSDFENGRRKPSLLVTLAYCQLGKVPMASIANDAISLNEFRKQLGTFHYQVRSGKIVVQRAR